MAQQCCSSAPAVPKSMGLFSKLDLIQVTIPCFPGWPQPQPIQGAFVVSPPLAPLYTAAWAPGAHEVSGSPLVSQQACDEHLWGARSEVGVNNSCPARPLCAAHPGTSHAYTHTHTHTPCTHAYRQSQVLSAHLTIHMKHTLTPANTHTKVHTHEVTRLHVCMLGGAFR